MSALSLFRLGEASCERLTPSAFPLERQLQRLMERHLEALLGVRKLATEYATSASGRIDTLGLDENGSPVILEYKRSQNENVVMQGLFYLDWLVTHRADFTLLVQQQLGPEAANSISWAGPRLICVAENYSRYDLYGVQQIARTIQLLRYHNYPDGLLMLELVNDANDPFAAGGGSAQTTRAASTASPDGAASAAPERSALDELPRCQPLIQECYAALREFARSLGADVTEKPTRVYVAFRKVKNFFSVQILRGSLALYLKLNPATVEPQPGFTRDVTDIGHLGTGDLELTIRSLEDVERAKPFIQRAYDEGL